jgi:ribonuclease HI
MPWVEATLRGQRVFARARDDGSLLADGGRVQIRYRLTDERSYRAALGNLVVTRDAATIADADMPAARPKIPEPVGRTSGRRQPDASPARSTWTAYADGACSGNPGPAGCGVVMLSPDGESREGFEYIGHATNNVAELTAILRAIEWLPANARPIVIYTDSQYAIGVLQKGWKAKVNQELVERTKSAVRGSSASLVYVPGHAGVALNELADALARRAVVERVTRVPPPFAVVTLPGTPE